MNRHGVTVAGTSVRDCVFRSVYSARNAEYQVRALVARRTIASLSPGETRWPVRSAARPRALPAHGNTGRCGWPRRRHAARGQAAKPARGKSARVDVKRAAAEIQAWPVGGVGVECRPRGLQR